MYAIVPLNIMLMLTTDIPLHKCAPGKNACLPNWRAFLDDVMSQSELTTLLFL